MREDPPYIWSTFIAKGLRDAGIISSEQAEELKQILVVMENENTDPKNYKTIKKYKKHKENK